jgi:predicted nuclease of restriction endonuclease-like (RecB) superfamily
MAMTKKLIPEGLLHDVRGLIAEARRDVARSVNSALVALYWNVGRRIRQDILKEKRAEYGEGIVAALGTQLELEFGRGYSVRNLWYMVRFVEAFPDVKIVNALRSQLGWTHFRSLIGIDDRLKREFYAEMCRIERWSTRTLEHKINHFLYERTAVAKKPADLIERDIKALRDEDRLSPDMVFKDPYFLDFLGLTDRHIEKDVEDAILREMENFILELGAGFTFVARQKRIQVDDADYYMDLLFYNRKLRRLVVIDLKLGKFMAEHKGQMELYLRWLEKHEVQPGEEAPVGLILCAGKSEEQIELLRLSEGGIRVAAYLTELPPKKLLEKRLHDAVRRARARLLPAGPRTLGTDQIRRTASKI